MRKVEIRLVNTDDMGWRVEVIEGAKVLASFGSWGSETHCEKHLTVELPDVVDVIVTRHQALVDLLKVLYPDATVVSHATPNDVKDKHVIGILPLHLAVLTKSTTTPALITPPELRGKELNMEQMIRYLQGFSSYVVLPYQLIEQVKEEKKRIDRDYEIYNRNVSLDSEGALSFTAWEYRSLVEKLIGGDE